MANEYVEGIELSDPKNISTLNPDAANPEELKRIIIGLTKLEGNWVSSESYTLNLSQSPLSELDSHNLFTKNIEGLWESPTFKTFKTLLDNYHASRGINEEFTKLQEKEIDDFIRAIYLTKPIQYIFKALYDQFKYKGTHTQRASEFKRMLRRIWFNLRSSGEVDNKNIKDTSAFEHIFLGEIKKTGATGLHNWLSLSYIQASADDKTIPGHQEFGEDKALKSKIIYNGTKAPDDFLGYKAAEKDPVISITFDYVLMRADKTEAIKEKKKLSTLFMGTTPEFEIALYTLFARYYKNSKNFNGVVNDIFIPPYRIDIHLIKSGGKIVTAFPAIKGRMPSTEKNIMAAHL
ncbi:13858_t:CDS:2 [Ambispora leptoticha]|uniref:13858_t:CDS:1 n=1 Tax=Ambispora leptoticha TaxID=144679 RepID=A0A9N8V953_9GLOM|nr:13858_t:CDS:2 [Ambispora leptoticha]